MTGTGAIALGAGVWVEICYHVMNRGVWRSPASALAWGVRGPRFESGYPDSSQTGSPFGELFIWKGQEYAGHIDQIDGAGKLRRLSVKAQSERIGASFAPLKRNLSRRSVSTGFGWFV